jgi:hypothetical protein
VAARVSIVGSCGCEFVSVEAVWRSSRHRGRSVIVARVKSHRCALRQATLRSQCRGAERSGFGRSYLVALPIFVAMGWKQQRVSLELSEDVERLEDFYHLNRLQKTIFSVSRSCSTALLER